MASKQSLRRIGQEAFRIIDEADERKQRLLYHPSKPTVHYVQPPQVSNVGKADKLPPRQTVAPPLGQKGYHVQVIPVPNVEREDQGGMMDCYEAARRYGGMVVTDYYPNRRMKVQRNYKAY